MSILDNSPCPKCGDPVASFGKFCTGCGTENPDFDRVEFAIQFGMNIEDFRKDTCEKGHPDLLRYIREMGEEPEAGLDVFCFVCGGQITPGVN